MEWKKVKLGCISTSIKTGPFGSQLHQSDYSDEGTPVVMPKDMLNGSIVENGIARVGKKHVEHLKRHQVKKGNILYSRRGDVGRCSFVTEKEEGWLCGTGCLKVELDESRCLPSFVFYLLQREDTVGWVENHAVGSTMPNLNTGILAKLPLRLPPLPTQQKIASILSTYDTLIENNTKRIRLLEQMAEGLYKEWFVRFRFPGHENVEMENGLPKGWKVEKLGNVANISTGKCNREDAEQNGIYPSFDRSQEIKKSSTWLKDCEAIIVPGEGTSFIPRYFKGKFNLHQRCYCVEPTNKETGKYLFYMLMTNRSYFLSVATGATVPSLRQNNFTRMSFVLPNISLVQKFDNIVANIFKEIDSLKERNTLLTRQRDLLLPRLMSGKLEITI